MTMSRDAKATLISSAIEEDRTEIRLIRDRIYSTATLITVGSFGISAFLLGKDGLKLTLTIQIKWLTAGIDGALLLIFWVLCCQMIRDIRYAQRWLEARQKLLDALVSGERVASNAKIYDIAPKGAPGIRHSNLFWNLCAVTAAIVIKTMAIWLLVSGAPALQG